MTPENRKSIFYRIGDGLVTGVGVVIVVALGGFVWAEYKDTKSELKRATELLKQQIPVNDRLEDKAKALRIALKELADLQKGQGGGVDLDGWKARLDEGSVPSVGEASLESLIDTQRKILAEQPM